MYVFPFSCSGPNQNAVQEEKLAYMLNKRCTEPVPPVTMSDQYKFCANLARFTKLSKQQFDVMTSNVHYPNRTDYHISNQLTSE